MGCMVRCGGYIEKGCEVESFLNSGPVELFINGRFVPAASRQTFETRDPGTGKVLATVAAGDQADIDAAVTAASEAFARSSWASMPANDRAAILHRLADLVDKHQSILAQIESLDVGKPFGDAMAFDVPNVAQTLRYYADLSVHLRRREPIAVSKMEAHQVHHPYGVCGFIIPWNFPLLLVGWGLGPALAAGNTVVVKPAEDTPLSTLYFCKLAKEAGIPAGVINVVSGLGHTAGAALSRHPGLARIQFTGSPEVGRLVAESAGRNLVPVKLELGGKGAAIVFDDVDIADTAAKLAAAITLNAGQVCCTATRWIIQKKAYGALLDKAAGVLEAIRIGPGMAEGTQMGPLVSEKQRKRVLGYMEKGEKQGASFVLKGGAAQVAGASGGFYVKPALLTGSPENVCCTDEIFGPVAFVMPFEEESEAIDLVNRSRYGLANSVWSSDVSRANRVAERLVAGNSWINAHNVFAHGIPYGGVNLSGMGGGVLGPDALLDYLRRQSVVRPLS
jgi:acyl-CoA reductase-like NAD-dependent aldehyde dehydrogenase